jgi:hypothetical protein
MSYRMNWLPPIPACHALILFMQVVLKRAHNFESIHAGVEAKITEYASRGYRALGFGLAEGAGGPDAPGTHWEFLGLLPLFDPPRWVALLLLMVSAAMMLAFPGMS